jgi:hypothetical protein
MIAENIPEDWLVQDQPLELPEGALDASEVRDWRFILAYLSQ